MVKTKVLIKPYPITCDWDAVNCKKVVVKTGYPLCYFVALRLGGLKRMNHEVTKNTKFHTCVSKHFGVQAQRNINGFYLFPATLGYSIK